MFSGHKDRERVLEHTKRNEAELKASETCGCVACGQVFPSGQVRKWIDIDEMDGQRAQTPDPEVGASFMDPAEGNQVHRTAICPHCGESMLIGDKGGFEVTPEFIEFLRIR
jgi:hypothetical protein